MPSTKAIAVAVSRANLTLNRRLDPDSAHLICQEWAMALKEISDEEFGKAFNAGMSRWEFFPSPAHILSIHRELNASGHPSHQPYLGQSAAHGISGEEAKRRYRDIRDRLEGRKSWSDLPAWVKRSEGGGVKRP